MRDEVWPLFGLRLETPRLEMRLPKEDEVVRLASSAPDDLETDPSWPPLPGASRQVATAVLQWYWRALGEWKIDHWRLPLAVWANGELVGFQELEAQRFAVLGTVESSSWLVPDARGFGIGKEMRAAVLTLAFEHLGASIASTGAWEWNAASLSVSRALGYVDNGYYMHEYQGRAAVQRRAVLERGAWEASAWPMTVEGLHDCRSWFGVPSEPR